MTQTLCIRMPDSASARVLNGVVPSTVTSVVVAGRLSKMVQRFVFTSWTT